MSRPDELPAWATDPNYPAGSKAWSSQPTKIAPTSGQKAQGAEPQVGFGAQQLNWLLNNHARWLDILASAVLGKGFYFKDEFGGDNSSGSLRHTWDVLTGGSGVEPAFVPVDTDGYGVVALELTGAGTSALSIATAVGTKNFLFCARIKRVSTAGAASAMSVGLFDIGGSSANDCLFRSTAGGNWFTHKGATAADSGVAASTSYQWLEVERRDGTVQWRIDGTVVLETSFPDDLTAPYVALYLSDATANAAKFHVDTALCWIDR